MNRSRLCSLLLLSLLFLPVRVQGEIVADITLLQSASSIGPATPEMQAAWRRLVKAPPTEITKLLAAMKGASPAAENWLRAGVDAIGEEALAAGNLPTDQLREFLADSQQSPRARETAFDWIVRSDPSAKQPLLAAMLNDSSLALRYDAVAQLLEETAEIPADQTDARIEAYERALTAARDSKQLQQIKSDLAELGEEVNLPTVYGFLKAWRLIGPFDHTSLAHFDTAYPPEEAQDFESEYDGKKGRVAWEDYLVENDEGRVDFIEAFGKEKEAIVYAYTTITATNPGSAEVRYQTNNGSKVWFNGKLIAAHEVYHSGGGFDQYRAKVELKKGDNQILVKLCQNEQKMPWENEWSFRLRVVDKLGTPIGKQAAAPTPSVNR